MRFVVPFEKGEDAGEDVLTFNVTVYDNPAGLGAKEWGLKHWEEGLIREIETVKVSGRNAYRFKIFGYDEETYHYYMPAGKEIYELDYSDPRTIGELAPDTQRYCSDIFQKVLESFSFE